MASKLPPYNRIVLVTGGRDFVPGFSHFASLASYLIPGTKLMHGACPTGADAWAHEFAMGLGMIPIERAHVFEKAFGLIEAVEADWKTHGKAAGPIRNQKMLDKILLEHLPTTVLAFPGNRGTANMVKIAKAAGVHVVDG